jgi:drug/metabolite transporter (DMT)-like permease
MEQKRPSAAFGAVIIVLTLVGWSSVPLFLRHFAGMIDPWTSNGWRYGFSALVWLPVLIVVGARSGLPPRLWKAALVPSVINAAGQTCFTWAHYRIDPGLLTFGLRTQLLFVAVGAWIMFPRERAIIRTPGYIAGALLLIAGMTAVILLDAPANGEHVTSTSTGAEWGTRAAYVAGIALALGSGMLFAGYGLAVRKYMEGVNSVLAFSAICQMTAVILVILMLLFGEQMGATALDLAADQFLYLLLSALIGIAIGHVFYYMAIARLGVAVSSGVLQLQPFLVALASMILFDEVLSRGQWGGGCVAVSGAMLMLGMQWRASRKSRSLEAPLEIAEGESGA